MAQISTPKLTDGIVRITCLAWFVIRIMTYKVGLISERTFPVIPVFDILETDNKWVHGIPYILSILCLLFLFLNPRSPVLKLSVIMLVITSAMLDMIAWRPWEYQFTFTLVVLLLNRYNPLKAHSAIIFILASTYIYSGLHKFNGGFLFIVWEKLILSNFMGLKHDMVSNPIVHYAGLLLPAIEVLGGLGLLLSKRKTVPAVLIGLMHLLLIVLLVSVSLKYAMVVIVWNVTMILMLYFLCIKNYLHFSFPHILNGRNRLIFLFYGLLPALSFVGYWPGEFSSELYSGKARNMAICINSNEVPAALQQHVVNHDLHLICNDSKRIEVLGWATTEVHIAPPGQIWYFEKFVRKFRKQYPDLDPSFIMYSYPFDQHLDIKGKD